MRFDKFTTKFQTALSDAQSLATGSDNQFIEPQHLLPALFSEVAGDNVAPLVGELPKMGRL